jgi:gamma-glutamyl hercynylcysteine S-oxide synthase
VCDDTLPTGFSDAETLAGLGAAVGIDFANGDTMTDIGEAFWAASVAAGNPLAFQPEGGGTIASLQWVKTGWGEGWPAPFIPAIDPDKWTETRHTTQVL